MATTNPGSIVRIRSRNSGRASVYEANMWAQPWSQGLYKGTGVIQNTTPAMNVLVGGSTSKPDVVIGQNPAGYKIALDLVGQQLIAVTAPASNSRIASIVAYTDDLSLVSTDGAITGSPSSCGLIVVYGTTSASPVAATDSQIRSAITADTATGSQAAYCIIANIPIASTTTSITNALISTFTSTIASQSIDFASGVWWEEIARAVPSGGSVDTGTFPARKYLSVIIKVVTQTGSVAHRLRFNGDTGANYNSRYNIDFGGVVSEPSSTSYIFGSTTVNFGGVGTVNISNPSSGEKTMHYAGTTNPATGAGTVPQMVITNGKYTGSQITRIQLYNPAAGAFAAGTEVIVRAHD